MSEDTQLTDAEDMQERLAEVQHRTELERKLKTSLTASAVAHEINQPLSRILLTSQIVMEKGSMSGGPGDPMQPYLKELTAEAQELKLGY